jgi:hypothetical protein
LGLLLEKEIKNTEKQIKINEKELQKLKEFGENFSEKLKYIEDENYST